MSRGAAVSLAVGVALVVGSLAYAISTGIVVLPAATRVERLLVIGTATDEKGTEVAAFAYVVNRSSGSVAVLDTMAPVTVAGTSARSAREALAFGGGAGVAAALSGQTDGVALEWVVVPGDAWSRLLEPRGVDLVIPERFSSYRDGSLVLLERGRQTVNAEEAVAVAGSLEYFDTPQSRQAVAAGLAGSVSAHLGTFEAIAEAVESEAARSSVSATRIRREQ